MRQWRIFVHGRNLYRNLVKEAGEIKHGRKRPMRVFRYGAPKIRAIRKKMRISQAEFAMLIGVCSRTLQNWEQGRREPEGPAKALLTVAEKNPKAVLEALHK